MSQTQIKDFLKKIKKERKTREQIMEQVRDYERQKIQAEIEEEQKRKEEEYKRKFEIRERRRQMRQNQQSENSLNHSTVSIH